MTVRERIRAAARPSLCRQFEAYIAQIHSKSIAMDWARLWTDIVRAYQRGDLSDAEHDRLLAQMP